MLLTIISLQEKVFNKYIVDQKKKNLQLNFADKSVLPSQPTLLTENLLANGCFSKKDILQIIRNSDSNNAHDMI